MPKEYGLPVHVSPPPCCLCLADSAAYKHAQQCIQGVRCWHSTGLLTRQSAAGNCSTPQQSRPASLGSAVWKLSASGLCVLHPYHFRPPPSEWLHAAGHSRTPSRGAQAATHSVACGRGLGSESSSARQLPAAALLPAPGQQSPAATKGNGTHCCRTHRPYRPKQEALPCHAMLGARS